MIWLVFPLMLIAGWVLGVVGFFKARRALRELAALRHAMAVPAPTHVRTSVPRTIPTPPPAAEPTEAEADGPEPLAAAAE